MRMDLVASFLIILSLGSTAFAQGEGTELSPQLQRLDKTWRSIEQGNLRLTPDLLLGDTYDWMTDQQCSGNFFQRAACHTFVKSLRRRVRTQLKRGLVFDTGPARGDYSSSAGAFVLNIYSAERGEGQQVFSAPPKHPCNDIGIEYLCGALAVVKIPMKMEEARLLARDGFPGNAKVDIGFELKGFRRFPLKKSYGEGIGQYNPNGDKYLLVRVRALRVTDGSGRVLYVRGKSLPNNALSDSAKVGEVSPSPRERDASSAEANNYWGVLTAQVRRNYDVSQTIPDDERIHLRARVAIRIDGLGHAIDVKLARSSGNVVFDNAVLAAVKKAAPFSPPPETERNSLEKTGVVLEFAP